MPDLRICSDSLVSPIDSLGYYFRKGGVSIIQAAFAHTYFVHPDKVRTRTPYYPNRARYSNQHYPGLVKGNRATFSGDGREVILDDNQFAQNAWAVYTGHQLARGSGYSLRHIWGNPWNPDMFTAGWNFCYMPFWAGMLTERQHPHPELQTAILQASWELYFKDNPVCEPPDCVDNPGVDLDSILAGQPLLILHRESPNQTYSPGSKLHESTPPATNDEAFERVKEIRKQTSQSWVNIRKSARLLQGKDYEPFGTLAVRNTKGRKQRQIARSEDLS